PRLGRAPARALAAAPAADDARRSRARAYLTNPGALRAQSLERGGSARNRAHHALAEAQRVRYRPLAHSRAPRLLRRGGNGNPLFGAARHVRVIRAGARAVICPWYERKR